MKQRNILLSCIFVFSLFGSAFAQSAVLASGSEATGNGGVVSYSIGQVSYITASGVDGSVAMGVQQAYEISTIAGVSELNIALEATAYPNPTTDYLILEFKEQVESDMLFSLYDINGKILKSSSLSTLKTEIDMKEFGAGTFFLNIMNGELHVKTFKITKH